MKLVMFDVDGTLVKTNKIDAKCFLSALSKEFGITGVNANWADYSHPTDSGILAEIVRCHLGHSVSDKECSRFQPRFVSMAVRMA